MQRLKAILGWTAAERQRYGLDGDAQVEANAVYARQTPLRASIWDAGAGAAQDTSHPSRPAPCTEQAPAAAAAARPVERSPLTSQGADAAPEEAPVAVRTRKSPYRLAVAAQAQEDAAAEGELVVATAKAMKLLSPEELERKRAPGFSLPLGCPTGPWQTDAAALLEVNRWASDHRKPGGGWSVTWLKGLQPGNSARGAQHVLGCAEHKKQSCGWQGRLEETEGWLWYTFTEHSSGVGKPQAVCFGHSHALAVSLGQRLAHAGMREIPEELCATAKTMREAGSSIKDVESWLRLEAVKRTSVEPAFNYEDVRRLVGPTTSQRAWDATDFIEVLAQRQREEGLPYFAKLDVDGRLENAFWVTRGGMEVYAVGCAGLLPRPCSSL